MFRRNRPRDQYWDDRDAVDVLKAVASGGIHPLTTAEVERNAYVPRSGVVLNRLLAAGLVMVPQLGYWALTVEGEAELAAGLSLRWLHRD